jgi:ribonuclease T2
MELVPFFVTTYNLFQKLPTMQFLDDCGIIPTNETTYTLESVEECLTNATGGFTPHVACNAEGYLNEVWYYFHLRGKIGDRSEGDDGFIGTNSTFNSTCPTQGIKYPPKLNRDDNEGSLRKKKEEQTHFEDL